MLFFFSAYCARSKSSYAGDLHAAMGDGEIVVYGAETPGLVRFKAEVVEVNRDEPLWAKMW